MMASWTRIEQADAWDACVQALAPAHILQSWCWGVFKSRWGWRAERWALCEGQSLRAAVQILRRPLGRLGCVLYAPKGPLAVDEAAYCAALSWLEQRGRDLRALWVKADGDPNEDGLTLDLQRACLRARGWRYAPVQVQFRNTALSEVQLDDEALLARMKPKWRYNIRLAERRGGLVRVVHPITDSEAHLLYALYAETAQRDNFAIRSQAYYADAWQTMNATALIAERNGEVLAGAVLFRFGDRAWYFYGMSRSEGREHMPNYLIQWRALQWAREQGCVFYDWWGAPEREDDPNDPLSGVWRFKQGFGARWVEGIGAWDYAPYPALYALYVGWMHWRRKKRTAPLPTLG
ncbi:MAG: peptidoglycan bridge formation glycyltransferase FemA/FemB family protein [Anaerolineae bacterium]|nr:peptidoglycan bridge formation glycyltransferase FemA/FemB family protein [Thermoflexales bacterium]MDW8396623.1 peptidoglycan bridge formation glycyltransferase FemA/FemB family protein [Anaerolineae bacterium]